MLRDSVTPLLRIMLGVWLASITLGCERLNDEAMRRDFFEIAKRELPAQVEVAISSSFRGEGDSDNFYQHVKFEVTAREDVSAKTGWLSSTNLKKGARSDGEVVLLYQRNETDTWVVTKYWLEAKNGGKK